MVVSAVIVIDTDSIQNLLVLFCVVSLGKKLNGTFHCSAVLASNFTIQSYLYKTTKHLQKQVEEIPCPMYKRLRRFPASQDDKYKNTINDFQSNKQRLK